MIETFVFDWSGVISNDAPIVYEANMQLLDDIGRERISFEDWKRLSALTPAGFLRNCGIECDEQETFETYRAYFNQLVTDVNKPEIVPGAKDTLENLRAKGRRLFVLSSHPAQNLRQEMQRYHVDKYHDDELYENVFGSILEKSVGLIAICHGLSVSGNSVLYTGDTIHDIQAAKEAGVRSCAIANDYAYHSRERLHAEDPDFLFGDITLVTRVI